jgi:hypothetical protein
MFPSLQGLLRLCSDRSLIQLSDPPNVMADLRQDWEPVVVRKKAPTSGAKKDEKAVNAARRSGAEVETIRKCTIHHLQRFVLDFPVFPTNEILFVDQLYLIFLSVRFSEHWQSARI